MPSFIIHEAVGKELSKKLSVDKDIFLIGNIAPDCWRNAENFGFENRRLSHFQPLDLNVFEHENYELFYSKYKNALYNSFHLGYLTHLITDNYCRHKGYFYKNENREIHDIDIPLIEHYKLEKLPLIDELEDFSSSIEELDITGLNGTIIYTNDILDNPKELTESEFKIDIVSKQIDEVCNYVLSELDRLENNK